MMVSTECKPLVEQHSEIVERVVGIASWLLGILYRQFWVADIYVTLH